MKRDVRLQTVGIVAIGFAAVCPAFALTDANPYSAIVGRNAFALKPPTPVATAPLTPVIQPATVELQGITTILGRPQVLLKLKLPAKPPEPAKDQSVVLDVGQREGEVEVLEIDSTAGVVRLKNRGEDLSLNMQDNAATPQAVAALPTPTLGSTIPRPPVSPGLPSAGGVPLPSRGAGTATLPTRQIRSDNSASAMGAGAGTAQQQPSMQTIERNVALYEANRLKNEELIKSGVRLPRMPQHSLLQQVPDENLPPE